MHKNLWALAYLWVGTVSNAVTLPPSLPASLVGNWKLVQITCNGEDSVTLPKSLLDSGEVSLQMTIPTRGDGVRSWGGPAGTCRQKGALKSMAATPSELTFTDGATDCQPTSCAEGCGVAGEVRTFPYSLTWTTLSVRVLDFRPYQNLCAGQAGPANLIYAHVD